MLDIDHFKSINDRYGHDVGDQVIVAVARLCGTQTRDSDVAARIGGEEFAILLPETNLDDAASPPSGCAPRSPSIPFATSSRAARGDREHRRGTRRGQRWPALPGS